MKVHQVARGFWEHEPSLTLGCKRLRPLAPKLQQANGHDSVSAFDLKRFIRPECGSRKVGSCTNDKPDSLPPPQVETHPGGTRWNPTQEQIGILEMLYKGGMRTPNAQQIEQITTQLSKYGKIEGKNVFYWFQNHKARERQKQKRSSLGLGHSSRTPPPMPPMIKTTTQTLNCVREDQVDHIEEDSRFKRKCRSWRVEWMEEEEDEGDNKTLELFPLHPEGR